MPTTTTSCHDKDNVDDDDQDPDPDQSSFLTQKEEESFQKLDIGEATATLLPTNDNIHHPNQEEDDKKKNDTDDNVNSNDDYDDDDWSTSSTASDPSEILSHSVASRHTKEQKKPNLAERRARNIQRNQEFLQTLQLQRQYPLGDSDPSNHVDIDNNNKKRNKQTKIDHENRNGQCKNSMMMAKMPYILQRIQDDQASCVQGPSLVQKYPHRQEQIRKLSSYLFLPRLSGQSMTHTTQLQLPPIFITGPPGTGKTSIVQDFLLRKQQEHQQLKNSFVSHAYVDCQTLDSPDSFTHAAYRIFHQNCKAETVRRRNNVISSTDIRKQSPSKRHSSTTTIRKKKEISFQKEYQSTTSSGSTALTDMADLGRRLQRLFATMQRRHGIVTNAAILIVDHAETLLSSYLRNSTTTTNNTTINRLAQLLLLPRTTFGESFPLTVVVITNSVLLEYTGLNHLASQWTIAGHIVPLRIHFPAYHGKRILKEILSQERLRTLITGEQNTNLFLNHPAAGFYDAVYSSFLETLVQAMCDLTTDIREYLRIGRFLWPSYVLPCSPANIHKTLERARKQSASGNGKSIATHEDLQVLKREILLILDQNIFPRVRHALEHGIGCLELDSPGTIDETQPQSISPPVENGQVPVFADYLLLAAYICQVNRPDTDKQIFSIQKNGRKRRRGNKAESARDDGEDVAFGLSFTDQNTHRARSFPLERLYSLYVNIINLNYSNNADTENGEDALRSLGTIEFDSAVASLIDIGVLHEYPSRSSTETKRLSQRSVWSSITWSEAQDAAKRVNFPLDRYTL